MGSAASARSGIGPQSARQTARISLATSPRADSKGRTPQLQYYLMMKISAKSSNHNIISTSGASDEEHDAHTQPTDASFYLHANSEKQGCIDDLCR